MGHHPIMFNVDPNPNSGFCYIQYDSNSGMHVIIHDGGIETFLSCETCVILMTYFI